jgi:hypothetical protein
VAAAAAAAAAAAQAQAQAQGILMDEDDEDAEGAEGTGSGSGGGAAGVNVPDLPFLRKGCLITISPDDLVSLSSRVMEARIATLTLWESKAVVPDAMFPTTVVPGSSAAAQAAVAAMSGRRSLKLCVGDTVEFVQKQKKSATAPPAILTGVVTRITFATNGPECKTVGQKMVRVTVFGPAGTVETTHSVSPGRIRRIIATAKDLEPTVATRLKSFFEKYDNAYRDCFVEWGSWTSDERAEYCARCTAGDMVAAAGIGVPTEEQVKTYLERARVVVQQARANVAALNASRGGPDEPAPRRRRQSKPRQPKETPPAAAEFGASPPARKRKSAVSPTTTLTGVPDVKLEVQQAAIAPQPQMTEDVAAYRELVRQLREEHSRKERELKADCDRRVEEVRVSLMAEIERLTALLPQGYAQQQ